MISRNVCFVSIGSCCGDYNASDWLKLGARHIDTRYCHRMLLDSTLKQLVLLNDCPCTSMDYGSEPNIGDVIKVG